MERDNPDVGLGVEFFVKAVENPRKSREEGRPVFEDREYVRIAFPGDRKREHVAPAHEMHYVSHVRRQMPYSERFNAAYRAFKDNNADFVAGTPIDVLPFLTESRRAELKALGVRTAEQMATMPDNTKGKLGMGGAELCRQAAEFLEASKESGEVAKLKAELAELRGQLASRSADPGDPYAGLSDDDLKNMIRDAGADVPRGVASRETLIKRLSEIAERKEVA